MNSFWNGFEKQAKDKKDDSSWWEKQKGVQRAMRKSDSGWGRVVVAPKLLKKRYKEMKKDSLKGLGIGGISGALLGAGSGLHHEISSGRHKTKGVLIGAGLGRLLGGAIDVATGLNSGMLRADKEHLKSRGIERGWFGKHKYSPEAKKKYIDAYRDKGK